MTKAGTVPVTLRGRLIKSFTSSEHRPTDLLVSIVAFLLLIATSRLVALEGPPDWEVNAFRAINNLPSWLFPIIWPFMQYGVFVTIPIAAAMAFYFRRYKLATLLLIGGVGIYYLARVVKEVVPRGRPGDLLESINAREKFAPGSNGFTSGHTAVAATIATFAHYYLSKRWRLISILTLGVVTFGRVYIGGHLPLDVLGGIFLGVGVASLINFIVGVPVKPITHKEETRQWVIIHRPRHPGDIIRMILAAFVFALLTVLALGQQLSQLEEALFRLVNYLPSFLSPLLQVIMQAGALFFVFIAAALALLFKHRRLFLKILFGGVTVWWLTKLAKMLVERDRPFYLLNSIVERATNSGILGFPSGHSAVAALLATVSSPYVPKRWSRLFWLVAWTVGISRVYVGAHLPLDVIAGLSLGWFFGSLLNLIFGTPAKPLPTQAIKQKLREAGLRATSLKRMEVDARGSTPMLARIANGNYVFIKFLDVEHRNADILYRLWRYLSLREVGDEAPFASTKQQAEHEAYLSIQAAQSGVRTPQVLLATPVHHRSAMVVTHKVEGPILSQYEGRITDKMLQAVWQEVAKLHAHRIAHRDLRAANVMIDRQKRPWLIDFSFAVTAATDVQLKKDIVELLVSTALLTNPAVAVRAAKSVLGNKPLQGVLPYLQRLALTAATKKLLRQDPTILAKLEQEIEVQTKSQHVKKIQMTRLNYKWLVLLFIIGASFYYFLPRLGELDDVLRVLKDVDIKWLLASLGASVLTYFMSAVVVLGSTAKPLAFGYTLLLQAATSVVNRITPKSLGGIALTQQYLEKNGLSRAEAIAAVSVAYASGIITHALLLLSLAIAFNAEQVHFIHVSTTQLLLLAAVIVISLGSLVFLPSLKRHVNQWSRDIYQAFKYSLSHPVKAVQIFGGSLAITLAYSLALYFALEGFGPAVAFRTVLLVYLGGSALASASPTPGGLGAAEAALTVGLSAVGVPLGQAVAGVLTFRFVTFWLPILPGLAAFRTLTKRMYG